MFKYLFNFTVLLIMLSYINVVNAQESPLIYQTFIRGGVGNNGGYISIINPLKFSELEKIDLPTTSVEKIILAPNKKLAFMNADPAIDPKKGLVVVDLENKKEKLRMFEGTAVYGIKLSPDKMLWALLDDTQEAVIINPTSLNIEHRITLEEAPRDVVFSPDSTDKRAYISSVNSNVFVYNYVTRGSITAIRNLPKGDRQQTRPQELELSPDGKTLYIGSEDTISIADTTTNIPIRVTGSFSLPRTSFGDFLIKASPDGNFVYIADYLGVNVYIYDVKKNITNKMIVSRGQGIITNLNISSDGKVLYISRFYGVSLLDIENNSFITTIVTSTAAGSPNPFTLGTVLTGDFSIGQAPTLKVISPSANDTFVANQEVRIKWNTALAAQSYSLASHRVELSTDEGQTFNIVAGAEELPGNAQEFSWTVPNIEVIDKAQIRVSTVDLGARRALSTSGIFSIIKTTPGDTQAPIVNFLSPKGNEQFDAGNTLQISWMSSDNVAVTSQDLSLSLDGGNTFPITIASGLIGTSQSFSFPIPESLSTNQARLRLVVKDAAGNMAQAVTLTNFTIKGATDSTPPTVTISNPSSNSSLIAGQSIQVNWQSTDNRAVVSQSLLISFDGGQNFTQIQAFGATDNSFVISNIDKLNFTTSQAIIRITAKDAVNTGQANVQFIIRPKLTMANYQAKILTINGLGFQSSSMTNGNSNIQVLINGKVVTVVPKSFNNMSITIKGNKKKLNLVKGNNTAQIMVDGVLSDQSSFQF